MRIVGGVIVAVAASCLLTGCGGGGEEKSAEPFVGRGTVIAAFAGLEAFERSAENCQVETTKGRIQSGSAVTVYGPGQKLLGNGELLDGVYEVTTGTLGATCVFSFTVEVEDTIDSAEGEYPYTVVLGDGSEWSTTADTLKDGFHIGV